MPAPTERLELYRNWKPLCIHLPGYTFADESILSRFSLPRFHGHDSSGEPVDLTDVRAQINKLGVDVRTEVALRPARRLVTGNTLLFSLWSSKPKFNPALPMGVTLLDVTSVNFDESIWCCFLLHHAEAIGLNDTQLAYLQINFQEHLTMTMRGYAQHCVLSFDDAQLARFVRLLNAAQKRVVRALGGREAVQVVMERSGLCVMVTTPADKVHAALLEAAPYLNYVIGRYDCLGLHPTTAERITFDFSLEGYKPMLGSASKESALVSREERENAILAAYRVRKLNALIS